MGRAGGERNLSVHSGSISCLDGCLTPCLSAVFLSVDTNARPLVFIFLLRVLSAVSLLVPETVKFIVCPAAKLEGQSLCCDFVFWS